MQFLSFDLYITGGYHIFFHYVFMIQEIWAMFLLKKYTVEYYSLIFLRIVSLTYQLVHQVAPEWLWVGVFCVVAHGSLPWLWTQNSCPPSPSVQCAAYSILQRSLKILKTNQQIYTSNLIYRYWEANVLNLLPVSGSRYTTSITWIR